MKDNPYGFYVTASLAKRICHVCNKTFKSDIVYLAREDINIGQIRYCLKCSLKLLKQAIANTPKNFSKTQLRKMYLKIKLQGEVNANN